MPSGEEIYALDTRVPCSFLQNYGTYWLVLFEEYGDVWTHGLLLVFIDFATSEFNVVKVTAVNPGRVDGAVFDQKDKRKFAIKVRGSDGGFTYSVVCGDVTDDMVSIRGVLNHNF